MLKIKFRYITLIITGCLSMLLLTSCLKDKECHFSYSLLVKINANPGTVDSISLYIFEKNEFLQEKITVPVNKESTEVRIPLVHLKNGTYTYVVWGNLSDKQVVPDASPSYLLPETSLFLKKKNNQAYISPDNLFYGRISATRDDSFSKEDEIQISRCISGVIIKAYNLLGFYNTVDKNFELKLRGTSDEIPFNNNLTTGELCELATSHTLHYEPDLEWQESDELLIANRFYVFPSAKKQMLAVDLYHKGVLLSSYNISNMARPNKIIEITLNFWNEKPEQWFNIIDWSTIDQEEDL